MLLIDKPGTRGKTLVVGFSVVENKETAEWILLSEKIFPHMSTLPARRFTRLNSWRTRRRAV